MNILFDSVIQLEASPKQVWEMLTEDVNLSDWQNGVTKATLVTGSPGYRGARYELLAENIPKAVVVEIKRSRPEERLQQHFKLGDCNYQQFFYLSRVDEDTTQLVYHCKREPATAWRKILNIKPSVPAFVKPAILESLANRLVQGSTAA